jgi:hypothetical protein
MSAPTAVEARDEDGNVSPEAVFAEEAVEMLPDEDEFETEF